MPFLTGFRGKGALLQSPANMGNAAPQKSAKRPGVAKRSAAAGASGDVGADVSRAVATFARGFAFTRSFTHPYVAERVGPVWVARDAPRKRASDYYRREEWIAHGVDPAEVDRIARQNTRGGYAVCDIRSINESDAPLRAAYKGLGYRLGTTEPMMMHRLGRIPRIPQPYPILRVMTPELSERLAKAAGSRQVLPEHLADDAPLRQYVALDGDRPAGWVRSIVVGDATWVSNMHVDPAYRRRGIGRSLLARMLRDDRAHGATASILLSSHTGALLYPRVGYEQIGELLLFTPRRR
jgi:GNAT superfamily N-acetyltransferase